MNPSLNVEVATVLHDAYEELAPQLGYETREDTKQFDPDSPNGRLMVKVVEYVGILTLLKLAEALEDWDTHTTHCDRYRYGNECAQCRQLREQMDLLRKALWRTPFGRLLP